MFFKVFAKSKPLNLLNQDSLPSWGVFEHPNEPNFDLSSSPPSLFYVLGCEGTTQGFPKLNRGLQNY